MKGLAPHTQAIFESISKLECIIPYTLVGGTALSLQIGTRLSEDLDFMLWREKKSDKSEVNWPQIKKELESIGEVEKMDLLGFDHVEFVVNGVKISFYASPNLSPIQQAIPYYNNVKLADITSIGAMKMEVMLRRSKFRDYYDIYSILEHGVNISDMIDIALKYSGHKLKTKNLIAMLTRSDRFGEDSNFQTLSPIYSLSAMDIENRIKKALLN